MGDSNRAGARVIVGIFVAFIALIVFFVLRDNNSDEDSLSREMIPRIWKAQFVLTGKSGDAKWGMRREMFFQYTVVVEAKSEILSKETLPTGEIELKKRRTFFQVVDSLVPSEVDFVLDLDTLPIKEFSKLVDSTGVLLASVGENSGGAELIEKKNEIQKKLENGIEGKGFKSLLEAVGQQLQNKIENKLNAMGKDAMMKELGSMSAISGKSYLIDYLQTESGQSLMIEFRNADGSEITDMEELAVLKKVNAFMDYHLIPDKKSKPGDRWSVYADEMKELLGSFVEGTYSGELVIERRCNEENGDWGVALHPSTVDIIGHGGSTIGNVRIEKGWATMDPHDATMNEMFFEGRARMEKKTRRFLVFTSKVEGWCRFQGRAVTEFLEDGE